MHHLVWYLCPVLTDMIYFQMKLTMVNGLFLQPKETLWISIEPRIPKSAIEWQYYNEQLTACGKIWLTSIRNLGCLGWMLTFIISFFVLRMFFTVEYSFRPNTDNWTMLNFKNNFIRLLQFMKQLFDVLLNILSCCCEIYFLFHSIRVVLEKRYISYGSVGVEVYILW